VKEYSATIANRGKTSWLVFGALWAFFVIFVCGNREILIEKLLLG